MALPLMMAAGLGILGGGQYLLKKNDDRRSQSMIPELQDRVDASPFAGTQKGANIMAEANRLANSSTLLQRNSGQIDSLFSELDNDSDAYNIAQMQTGAANQRWMMEQQFAAEEKHAADYQAQLADADDMQVAFQRLNNALDTNDSASAVAAMYDWYNLMDAGIITQNEERAFLGTGGFSDQLAAWMNKAVAGEGLTPKQVAQIRRSAQGMYKPAWENHQRIKTAMDDRQVQLEGRFRNTGQQFISPQGTQGIDWGMQIPGLNPAEQAAASSVGGSGAMTQLQQEIVRLQQQNAALLQQQSGQSEQEAYEAWQQSLPPALRGRDDVARDAVFYDPRAN